MKNAGIHVISTDFEIYESAYWLVEKRPKLEKEGVPEVFLKVQDLSQKEGGAKSINSVYHRKFMIIDDKMSWLGSLNVGSEYLWEGPTQKIPGNPRGISPDSRNWHDGMFVIKGSEVAKRLNFIFAQQWMVLGGDIFELNHSEDVQELGDGRDMLAIFLSFPGNPVNCCFEYYEQLIQWCEGNVIIENPYIIDEKFWHITHHLEDEQYPKLHFITCLKETDHLIAPPSVKAHALIPYKKGTKFTDYSAVFKRFAHWKIAIDYATKTVFHGSTNLNTRSARHDFEINVLVKSNRLFKEVKKLLQYDIATGRPIPEKDLTGPKIADKAISQVAAYFS